MSIVAVQQCRDSTGTTRADSVILYLCSSLSLSLSVSLSLISLSLCFCHLFSPSFYVSLSPALNISLYLSLSYSISFSPYIYVCIHILTLRAGPSLGSREMAMLKYLRASLEWPSVRWTWPAVQQRQVVHVELV